MKSGAFYIVGPTASGKSTIAAAVASRCNAEVIGADAFQIYRGLARLTAQPDAATLAVVPHHLVACIAVDEWMSVAKFRDLALQAMRDITARGRNIIVAGGSGLYVASLTDGLSALPAADPKLRARLEELSLRELKIRLELLDPAAAKVIDSHNKRRLLRAVEICLLTGKRVSAQRTRGRSAASGVFLYRDRDDLHQRINLRVEEMFAAGVVEEIKNAPTLGATAEQALGVREIRQLINREITAPECIAQIQQATRQYAKRQLTWFRRQSTFEPLNLSNRSTAEVIELIAEKARLTFAQ